MIEPRLSLPNLLISTDGTWNNTSIVDNTGGKDEPVFANCVRAHITFAHDKLGRNREATTEGFIEYLDGKTASLFPGRIEVAYNSKSLVIRSNEQGVSSVLYDNINDENFDDEVLAWRQKHKYFCNEFSSVLTEVKIEFDYPRDYWMISMTLFQQRILMQDEITKIIIGGNK